MITIILGVVLARLSYIDIRTFRLPDAYTLPLIVAGLVLNTVWSGAIPFEHVAAASAGYLIFALIGSAFFWWRGIDGLGLGDAKLLAAAGAWIGLRGLPVVVLVAAIGGIVAALLTASDRNTRIAFGPWLALGFFVVWVAR